MREWLKQYITAAASAIATDMPGFQIERTRRPEHGDYACNIALLLGKTLQQPPKKIAEKICAHFAEDARIANIQIAGPGFINFFFSETAFQKNLIDILQQTTHYGHSTVGQNQRVNLEFVSANPTGPLHVGHGRSAAYGASLGNLLSAAGFQVHREYYVNDAGRQMDILATSVWLRYLERCGAQFDFPSNAYRGDYIYPIADRLLQEQNHQLQRDTTALFQDLPPDTEPDLRLDTLIQRTKTALGDSWYRLVHTLTLNEILEDIRQDLSEFGVHYDEWFSEKSLTENGAVAKSIALLKDRDHTYELEGALWFRATTFGDEKDRVLIRANGQTTYFASDVAYHLNKFQRGFKKLIYIVGADHHGYAPRLKASITATGDDPHACEVLLVQFVTLYRGQEQVQMSTRSGEFITLRELRKEVGNDAARFFYILRKREQHLDFDLALAKSQSNDNPVYYLQYAYARICSVWRQLSNQSLTWDRYEGEQHLALLVETHERALMRLLSHYSDLLEVAALNYEPHALAHYLREIATAFHAYYNAEHFLVDTASLRHARLYLVEATRQVLSNGLDILGISKPEVM